MPWFMREDYDDPQPIPRALLDVPAGPRGIGLVSVYSEGRTTPGWGTPRQGDPGFGVNYAKGKFWAKPRLEAFAKAGSPFAIVTRSLAVVVFDIDRHEGAADGVIGARALGELPPTLASTSKSGEGRHLFYSVPDTWDDTDGFGRYADQIGMAPGVDFRAQGCVYHYASQRWNGLPVEPLPEHLLTKLELTRDRKIARTTAIAAAAAGTIDDEEVLLMHDQLLTELKKPIAAGKRNNSLFAIGSQMKTAEYPQWEKAVEDRAVDLGLDAAETAKIIDNINKYA